MCPMCAIKNILPVEGLGECRRLSHQGTLNSSWRRLDLPIGSLELLYDEKTLEAALRSVWGFHTSGSTKWSIYAVWPIGLLAKWVLFLNVRLNEALEFCFHAAECSVLETVQRSLQLSEFSLVWLWCTGAGHASVVGFVTFALCFEGSVFC